MDNFNTVPALEGQWGASGGAQACGRLVWEFLKKIPLTGTKSGIRRSGYSCPRATRRITGDRIIKSDEIQSDQIGYDNKRIEIHSWDAFIRKDGTATAFAWESRRRTMILGSVASEGLDRRWYGESLCSGSETQMVVIAL